MSAEHEAVLHVERVGTRVVLEYPQVRWIRADRRPEERARKASSTVSSRDVQARQLYGSDLLRACRRPADDPDDRVVPFRQRDRSRSGGQAITPAHLSLGGADPIRQW